MLTQVPTIFAAWIHANYTATSQVSAESPSRVVQTVNLQPFWVVKSTAERSEWLISCSPEELNFCGSRTWGWWRVTMAYHIIWWHMMMVFHGFPWFSMVFHGFPWFSMVIFHGIVHPQMVCHGCEAQLTWWQSPSSWLGFNEANSNFLQSIPVILKGATNGERGGGNVEKHLQEIIGWIITYDHLGSMTMEIWKDVITIGSQYTWIWEEFPTWDCNPIASSLERGRNFMISSLVPSPSGCWSGEMSTIFK